MEKTPGGGEGKKGSKIGKKSRRPKNARASQNGKFLEE